MRCRHTVPRRDSAGPASCPVTVSESSPTLGSKSLSCAWPRPIGPGHGCRGPRPGPPNDG
eukprot:768377-Hanusia_phi.AAC.8